MVYGDSGLGIQGIAQTEFFIFVTSSRGLSELGISIADASKLLRAYQSSFRATTRGSRLEFWFGDQAKLIASTPHPATGTGRLKIKSWMLWVISLAGNSPEVVKDRGFVPRAGLGPGASPFIRLPPPEGGLMLKQGSAGSAGAWRFPPHLTGYADKWIQQNTVPIQTAIVNKISELMRREGRSS